MSNSKSLLKISEVLNDENFSPFVLGALLSRIMLTNDKNKIYAVANFNSSKFVDNITVDEYLPEYLLKINVESGDYPYWVSKNDFDDSISNRSSIAAFIIENDLSLDVNSLYNRLYTKLITAHWTQDDNMNDEKKKFIRGFIELRGSIDTTASYISQDFFYNSQFELKKARFLVDYCSIPYYIVNVNFRELQNDFVSGKSKRNTQLRIERNWYLKNIGLINDYKVEIYKNSLSISYIINKVGNITYIDLGEKKYNNSNILNKRIDYYSTFVFGKKITEKEIEKLREELGFDEAKSIRSAALAKMIKENTPDICMGCEGNFDLSTRTHTKKNGKPYLEIHHVISLGKNKELDDENNLVKLCPVCHKTLGKNYASEGDQKELITSILLNAHNVLDFAKHIYDTSDFELIVDRIQKSLE